MFKSIWEDIQQQYHQGNMVIRLVIINVAIFVVVNLLYVILSGIGGGDLSLYNKVLHWFCISSDPLLVLLRPWSLFTNMFLHEDFWHILWNMLYLYWFGRIFGDLLGDKKVLPLYLLGGLAGTIAFFLSANLLSYGGDGTHFALGASGAVMAIVAASGFVAPDYIIRLIFLGDVKLKYIVAVLLFLDIVGAAGQINTGGHWAHLGGAAFGWFFVAQLRQGNDWSVPVNNFLDKISNFFDQTKSRRPKMAYKNPNYKKRKRSGGRPHAVSDDDRGTSHQEQLDMILDKIKVKGYDSLSSEEKEFLFKASKK